MKNLIICLVLCSKFFVLSAQETTGNLSSPFYPYVPLGTSTFKDKFYFQDSKGFIWGVRNLLTIIRYDGNKYEIFPMDEGDSTSYSVQYFSNDWEFIEDQKGKIWIRTYANSLNLFDPETGEFKNLIPGIKKQFPQATNLGAITDIINDRDGNIWITAINLGVLRYDQLQKTYELIAQSEGILKIFEDTEGQIWGYSWETEPARKLARLNRQLRRFESIGVFPKSVNPSKPVNSVLPGFRAIPFGNTNSLFLLVSHIPFLFDPAAGSVSSLDLPLGEKEWIEDVFGDKERVWIRTNNDRIYQFTPPSIELDLIHDPTQEGLRRQVFLPAGKTFQVRDGSLWFPHPNEVRYILPGGGLFTLVTIPGNFKNNPMFLFQSKVWFMDYPLPALVRPDKKREPSKSIKPPELSKEKDAAIQFAQGSKNELWGITTKKTENSTALIQFRRFDSNGELQYSYSSFLPKDMINNDGRIFWNIKTDPLGRLWLSSGVQLWRLDPTLSKEDPLIRETDPKLQSGFHDELNTGFHYDFLVDEENNLWIDHKIRNGQSGKWGLSPFFLKEKGSNIKRVNTIFEDWRGNIWYGTFDGAICYSPAKNEYRRYSEKQMLPDIFVKKFFEDQQKNLWVVTSDGSLSRYYPRNDRFIPFTWKDGVKVSGYPAGILMDEDGYVYIQPNSGNNISYFHPLQLMVDSVAPEIFFTSLELFNRPVQPNDSTGLLQKSLDFTEFITFKFAQNDFTIHFTVPEYIHNEEMVFAILMEGFQDDWQEVGNKREARFTNLSPGRYTFKVKVRNHHGFWSETPRTLQITILPPWYRTTWAYVLWLTLTLATLYSFYRFQLRRRLAIAEAERLKEMDLAKTQLYTNITHEFRTPLTVILGMAEQVKSDPKNWFNEGLRLIGRNGRHLLHLVNQLLDLSKLESGQMALHLTQGDVIGYLNYLTESFYSYADSKDIRLHFVCDLETLEMDYDPEKLQHIVSNLLSNAIKFTQAGGDVYVQLAVGSRPLAVGREQAANSQLPTANCLLIIVRDNGPGIAPEHLPHIFDRFYQADASATRRGEGTGIGLALTKELVKAMGGEIGVESTLGKGAKFSIRLPITHTAPSASQPAPEPSEALLATALIEKEQKPVVEPVEPSDRYTVLLVEDNEDVITYLSSILSLYYQIETARNGREGIEKALALTPDLIVSDVMMPDTDGFELCQTLKSDERSSHIPIILLTAKSDQAAKVEGLTYGADAYLTKPFHQEELLVRVEKLIEQRRKLQERYRGTGSLRPLLNVSPESLDDTFLQKVVRHIETYLADEEYGMPQLCKAMHMSRSNLFRKLKALTGQSATDLIRNMRLEKAKELLEHTEMSVSEVCFAVGFTNASYFSRVFREMYGKAPSEWGA